MHSTRFFCFCLQGSGWVDDPYIIRRKRYIVRRIVYLNMAYPLHIKEGVFYFVVMRAFFCK